MTRVVLDASVIAKLFSPEEERHHEQAEQMLDALDRGELSLLGPELVMLEVLNVAARKWSFEEPELIVLAQAMRDLDIDLHEVELDRVAAWAGAGLSAYDAAYVAVAEAERVPLVTDDAQIVRLAPDIAVPLASYREP